MIGTVASVVSTKAAPIRPPVSSQSRRVPDPAEVVDAAADDHEQGQRGDADEKLTSAAGTLPVCTASLALTGAWRANWALTASMIRTAKVGSIRNRSVDQIDAARPSG